MAEYINKERAKELLNEDYAYAAANLLDKVPIEDVVKVVRCKDCKHHGKDETGYWCNKSFNSFRTEEDNFCKFGAKLL